MGGGDHGHGGGEHGHDHGHNLLPKIPDPKVYRVEAVPELMSVKRALAARGLKDPWLRNEVWRYDPKSLGTGKQILRQTIGRGMLFGFIAAVITTGIGKLLDSGDHGEHGEHH